MDFFGFFTKDPKPALPPSSAGSTVHSASTTSTIDTSVASPADSESGRTNRSTETLLNDTIDTRLNDTIDASTETVLDNTSVKNVTSDTGTPPPRVASRLFGTVPGRTNSTTTTTAGAAVSADVTAAFSSSSLLHTALAHRHGAEMRTLEAGGSHLLAALVKGERTLSELSWHFALLLPRAVAVDIVALRSPMRHYSIGEKALEALQYSAEVRMEVRTLLEWRRQAFDTLAAVHDRQRDLLRSHLEDRFEDISGDVYEDGFEDDPEDDHEGAGGAAVLLSGAGAGAVAVADAAALTAKADRWGDDAVRLRVRIGAAEEKVLASVLKKRPGLSFSRRTGKAMPVGDVVHRSLIRRRLAGDLCQGEQRVVPLEHLQQVLGELGAIPSLHRRLEICGHARLVGVPGRRVGSGPVAVLELPLADAPDELRPPCRGAAGALLAAQEHGLPVGPLEPSRDFPAFRDVELVPIPVRKAVTRSRVCVLRCRRHVFFVICFGALIR